MRLNFEIEKLIDLALNEDIGTGDVTSDYFVEELKQARCYALVKQDGIVAGYDVFERVFEKVDQSLKVSVLVPEGTAVKAGTRVLEISGSARSILMAERIALNFMQRLSGIATITARYVAKVEGTVAKVLDTRKTVPGWRELEKSAVVFGGGTNHRMGLFDRVLVKDNHIVVQQDVETLQKNISRLKKDKPEVEVELEADTLEQVEKFLKLEGVDYIMLDNMSNEMILQAIEMRGENSILLEASGGVNLETIASIAATGVDFISVGALTHSAKALDISLDFVPLSE